MSANRLLPLGKNKTNATVYWFYMQFYGSAPDASIYARHNSKKNPRAIRWLFESDPDMQTATYDPIDVANLIYYLEDSGVEISDLGVATISGLMFSYMNRNKSEQAQRELQKIVDYLRGTKSDETETNFNAPSGW